MIGFYMVENKLPMTSHIILNHLVVDSLNRTPATSENCNSPSEAASLKIGLSVLIHDESEAFPTMNSGKFFYLKIILSHLMY